MQHSDEAWKFVDGFDQNRKDYQKDAAFPLVQGKMLGGSSSINSMFYVRGQPRDYQIWADISGDQSWNYENILPYFKKSEHMEDATILHTKYKDFHGTDGYLHITKERYPRVEEKYFEMMKELGREIIIDDNANETLGFTQASYTISGKGIRQSTAYSFLTPIIHRHNLDVLKHTQVTKILFDEFKNAIGVEALNSNNEFIEIMANKEVIVTAGAFNSPKLLLLSAIGRKEYLKQFGIQSISNLPVGENLQDHVGSILAYTFKESHKPAKPPNYDRRGSDIVGNVALNKSQAYPDYQSCMIIYPNDSEGPMQTCINLDLNYDVCQVLHDANKGREMTIVAINLLHPKSSGVVQLNSTNPKDDPLIYLRYFSDDSDLDVLAESVRDFDKIRTTSYFKTIGAKLVDFKLPKCSAFVFGSKEYWRCHVLSTRFKMSHYIGTCAMGSVLDSRLRVRGVQRLRVADSSAIPYMPGGNINAPVIMLAERAADIIKEDHGY